MTERQIEKLQTRLENYISENAELKETTKALASQNKTLTRTLNKLVSMIAAGRKQSEAMALVLEEGMAALNPESNGKKTTKKTTTKKAEPKKDAKKDSGKAQPKKSTPKKVQEVDEDEDDAPVVKKPSKKNKDKSDKKVKGKKVQKGGKKKSADDAEELI